MSSSYDKFQKRRLISSYFSVVLSVFLVLFLLGMLGLFIINSKKLADDFRENIAMTVFFKNEANDTIIKSFDAELKKAPFAKTFEYVSKDAAAKQHTDIIGEDFVTFLGENPLQNSFDIHLKADYVYRDSIAKVESQLRKNPMISDIVYDKQLVNLVNDNIKKVSMWILIISGFFTIIAVLLINSSLRLSIHSNRFIIKTMQMVGATRGFISRPMTIRAIINGMISAVIAIILIISLITWAESLEPQLKAIRDTKLNIILFAGMLFVGVGISWYSTHRSVLKYLKMKLDDLY